MFVCKWEKVNKKTKNKKCEMQKQQKPLYIKKWKKQKN